MHWVELEGSEPLEGAVSVAPGETEWTFAPSFPWRSGSYELVVDGALEDRSGNSVDRAFETPLDTPGRGAVRRVFHVAAR